MKKNRDEIDESSFLSAIRGNTPPKNEPEEKQEIKSSPPIKKRKTKESDSCYTAMYLQPSPESARLGKSINIRPEYHDMLSKLLRVVTQNKVSLFSYVDNVLARHFEEHQEEINRLYRENYKDLF